jgi:hypothetical protein
MKIRTLLNGQQSAGKQTLTFHGSGTASGIYVYMLKVGKSVKSRKMLLLRQLNSKGNVGLTR